MVNGINPSAPKTNLSSSPLTETPDPSQTTKETTHQAVQDQASESAKQAAQQSSQQNVQDAADQATKSAEQAAQTEMAQRAAQAQMGQAMTKEAEKPEALAYEFLNLFESIFKEGYEGYKPPTVDEGAGVFSEFRGKEFQKDMQILRQFMREVKHLVSEEGVEPHQLIHYLKAEQGGKFWQRLEQALQKGILTQKSALPLKSEKDVLKAMKKSNQAGLGDPDQEARLGLDRSQQLPGRALLEILRAEANPKGQIEAMVLALQILKQDGLRQSSDKLVTYLRHRWGMSDEELRRFLRHYHIDYFQGPMPKEERVPQHLWQIFIVLLSVPVALLLGLDLGDAAIVGGVFAVLLIVLSYLNRKK